MRSHSDEATIFAVASGAGRAAITIVRVSGLETERVVAAVCRRVPEARRATYLALQNPVTEEILDRGVALWFPGPSSFTGEDAAEFHLHGGRAVVAAFLTMLSGLEGVRPAEAGEFTRRAYLNGRMDLTEVEGLADLIDAETDAQRRQALRQLDGPLGRQTELWRGALLDALATVESAIDFSDEGDIPETSLEHLQRLVQPTARAIASYLADAGQRGIRLRDGFTVVIAGPPNAGKSTLLNALAMRDIAIVSPFAGTTRDPIEVYLDLGGWPLTLVDTAGLRDGVGPVEQEGIARARGRAAGADLVLWLSPVNDPVSPPSASIADTLVVATKADLGHSGATSPGTVVSAATGAGIAELLSHLQQRAAAAMSFGDMPALTRTRHIDALTSTLAALTRVSIDGDGQALELVAEDLRIAARHLGRITGRIDVEDVLDAIFSRFCIGK